MFESFVELFSEMKPVVYVLFVVGIIFCVVEILTPGTGFFGISGIVCVIAGIIMRMIQGGDIFMFIWMILIFIILFVGGMLLIMRSGTKGWLSRTPIFNVGTAVPEGITEGTKDFSSLIGATGITITILRPIGQAKINDEVVDVIAQSGMIEQNVKIVVIEVEGQRVVVKEK